MSQETESFQKVARTRRAQGFVLALDSGSSSLKFALFDGSAAPVCILSGAIDRIGLPKATFTMRMVEGQQTERAEVSARNHVSCLDYLLARLADSLPVSKLRVIASLFGKNFVNSLDLVRSLSRPGLSILVTFFLLGQLSTFLGLFRTEVWDTVGLSLVLHIAVIYTPFRKTFSLPSAWI